MYIYIWCLCTGFKGNVRVILPGLSACMDCTLDLYPPQVQGGREGRMDGGRERERKREGGRHGG